MSVTRQDPRYFAYSSFPKRQCAVTGIVDGNGQADFLAAVGNSVKLSATSDDPLVVTWANGFDPFPVDYAYKWELEVSPSEWTTLPLGTHYLYIDYDPVSESVNYGKTTILPEDSPTPPSHGSGVHWFDTSRYKMYESVSGNWEERIRVFVGQCVSDGSTVTDTISYAYSGIYTSTPTAVTTSQTYVFEHNLGTRKYTIRGFYDDVTGATGTDVGVGDGTDGYVIGDGVNPSDATNFFRSQFYFCTRLFASLRTGNSAIWHGVADGYFTGATALITVERSY